MSPFMCSVTRNVQAFENQSAFSSHFAHVDSLKPPMKNTYNSTVRWSHWEWRHYSWSIVQTVYFESVCFEEVVNSNYRLFRTCFALRPNHIQVYSNRLYVLNHISKYRIHRSVGHSKYRLFEVSVILVYRSSRTLFSTPKLILVHTNRLNASNRTFNEHYYCLCIVRNLAVAHYMNTSEV